MNILFVTPPPYLPNRLHRIRAFELIKILSKKHALHLLAITTEKKNEKEFEELKKVCASTTVVKNSKMLSFLSIIRFPHLPYEVAYCHSQKIQTVVAQLIKKHHISLLYLKRLRSASYLPPTTIPVVMDATDAMSLFYFRMFDHSSFPKNIFYLFEALKYRSFEKKTMEKVTHWIVSSPVDAAYLESFGSATITTIPNPVDTTYFSFPKEMPIKHSLIFRGLMDKKVNSDAMIFFVNEIFPLIKKSIPDITLSIVGPNPLREIKDLADQKHIFVTGFVADVRKEIAQSEIVICPIRIGTGTRHKILHAWAMKKPVVSTSQGAQGLTYENEKNILIADSPALFAKQVIRLLKSKALQKRLTENDYKTVKKYYRNTVVEKQLNELLNNVSA